MICLLCYESNKEFISVDSEHNQQFKISNLLYKYFRFCFDVSIFENSLNSTHELIKNIHVFFFVLQYVPNDGDICLKCWNKTLAFHEFYLHIETIHNVINKSKDVFGSLQETVKVEINEENSKCDPSNDDDWFQNEPLDDISSNSSQGIFQLHFFACFFFQLKLEWTVVQWLKYEIFKKNSDFAVKNITQSTPSIKPKTNSDEIKSDLTTEEITTKKVQKKLKTKSKTKPK